MDRLPMASGFSAIQNNSDLSQGLIISPRLAARSTTRTVGILMPFWSVRSEQIKVAGDPQFDCAIRRCAMNMSVTQFVMPPAIVGRSRSVWHDIIDRVIEGPPRTAADEIAEYLRGISTIYRRRCGLSLSGVTSAYSADEPLRRRRGGQMSRN
jgi:hypothetical protein